MSQSTASISISLFELLFLSDINSEGNQGIFTKGIMRFMYNMYMLLVA